MFAKCMCKEMRGYFIAIMKLIWCCLLAVFVAVSFAAIDVEKTVKQVQSILQANQQLPRLTRDEILELLNDIRSEDSKSSTSTKEPEEAVSAGEIPLQYSAIINEVNLPLPNILENIVGDNKDIPVTTLEPPSINILPKKKNKPPLLTSEKSFLLQQLYPQAHHTPDNIATDDDESELNDPETTTTSKPTLMVVLPYTPRDGSSLQELYTRPPRVQVVHESSTTVKPKTSKPFENYPDNAGLSTELITNFPDELKAFLDAHGLKGKPGQDNFLLPLEGFKPMPPVKIVDGTVDLPENILLTYDLISPTSDSNTKNEAAYSMSPSNFLYSPLRPELPFELDASSSETKEISIPFDMPVKKYKSGTALNYDPIEYESVKVIPLNKGINPISEQISSSNDQSKRQVTTNETTTKQSKEESTTTTSTTTEEPKTNVVSESVSVDADTGASISDLEASFGGAVPPQPGDSELPPPKKNGFYWMLDWNSFLEVGDGDTKVNIRFEPKLGDPQMFLPVTVP
ncbi:unnamed protein product [Arctia plantaginis]|uniref:Uncharacterized protein n=1 Tax=Arctia plantaginis TaxID=874455 RepID=A0A8S1BAK0_ARCPL|nr:unnamed protein product [Arctia plantaginis]